MSSVDPTRAPHAPQPCGQQRAACTLPTGRTHAQTHAPHQLLSAAHPRTRQSAPTRSHGPQHPRRGLPVTPVHTSAIQPSPIIHHCAQTASMHLVQGLAAWCAVPPVLPTLLYPTLPCPGWAADEKPLIHPPPSLPPSDPNRYAPQRACHAWGQVRAQVRASNQSHAPPASLCTAGRNGGQLFIRM